MKRTEVRTESEVCSGGTAREGVIVKLFVTVYPNDVFVILTVCAEVRSFGVVVSPHSMIIND